MNLPVVLQTNAADCGVACLAMIAAAHGRRSSLPELRRSIGHGAQGNTVKAIIDLARTLGLRSRALRLEPNDAHALALPCLLLWGTRHFVVLKRATRRSWTIHDPAVGVRRYRRSEVDRYFSGIAVELTPSESFRAERPAPRLEIGAIWAQATGIAPVLATLAALSVVLQAVALVAPMYVQLVVDDGLAHDDRELLAILGFGFAGIAAIGAITTYLRSAIALYAGAALSDRIAANLCDHLLRLPLLFFVQREIGDLNARFGSLAPILKVFTSGIVAVLIDGLLACTTLVLLRLYDATLTWVVVAFWLASLVIQLAGVPKLRDLKRESIRANAAEQTIFIESLRSILSLKANAMEGPRADLWRNQHLEAIDSSTRQQRFQQRLDLVRALVAAAENMLIVYLGAVTVLRGDLTVGMLYAFIAYKSHFVRAASSLVDQAVEIRMLKLHLERLAEIAHAPAETTNAASRTIEAGIRGGIAARGIRFRYAPHLPEVLCGVSFEIEPGCEVALVGGSGSGKSTLLRVLLGLIAPDAGDVIVDGARPIGECRAALKAGTGVVLQGDSLFTGTIRDNVGLFELDVDADRVAECCRVAAIDADVDALPMGYDTPLGDMGVTLSAGQIQRLLIARALYKRPRILVLDEATANLDDATRARLNSNVRALGITLLRVTHRPDEIAACDRVYALEHGRLRELATAQAASR